MSEISYASAPVPVRADLRAAHTRLWKQLAEPGTWWTGAERVAIAAEVRQARQCQVCKERKAALSPAAVQGKHNTEGVLPETVVEMIHRITTDPDTGIGYGVRGYYYFNGAREIPLFRYTPYLYRAFVQYFATTNGRQNHGIELDYR